MANLILKLIIVVISSLKVITYIGIGFIGIMLIQLISYRVFHFNIYKTLVRKFMEV